MGRPEKRDPEAVRDDVRNELVSVEMAREVYKVVIDPETFEIDRADTADLRRAADTVCDLIRHGRGADV